MTEKKRPPTSGTRKGNGAGYGGPARGAGREIPTIQHHAPFDHGNAGPQALRTSWRDRTEELAQKAMDTWESVIDDPEQAAMNKIVAAEKIINRVDGTPVQRIATPVGNTWFMAGVPEIENTRDWERRAQLVIAKPAGSAD